MLVRAIIDNLLSREFRDFKNQYLNASPEVFFKDGERRFTKKEFRFMEQIAVISAWKRNLSTLTSYPKQYKKNKLFVEKELQNSDLRKLKNNQVYVIGKVENKNSSGKTMMIDYVGPLANNQKQAWKMAKNDLKTINRKNGIGISN